jgi:hypothetical protein
VGLATTSIASSFHPRTYRAKHAFGKFATSNRNTRFALAIQGVHKFNKVTSINFSTGLYTDSIRALRRAAEAPIVTIVSVNTGSLDTLRAVHECQSVALLVAIEPVMRVERSVAHGDGNSNQI